MANAASPIGLIADQPMGGAGRSHLRTGRMIVMAVAFVLRMRSYRGIPVRGGGRCSLEEDSDDGANIYIFNIIEELLYCDTGKLTH